MVLAFAKVLKPAELRIAVAEALGQFENPGKG
jgi:hypothetical protein